MRANFFLRFIQRGGIGDPLAPLLSEEGINDEMGGADEACFHRGCSLDGDEGIHECLINAATKLTESLR